MPSFSPSSIVLSFACITALGLPATPQTSSPTPPVQTQLIYVSTERGIEPDSIDRQSGPFLLIVKNQAYDRSIQLSLSRTDTSTPTEIVPPTEVIGSNHDFLLNLDPGTYDLTEQNHPAWKLHLVVTK